MRVLVLGHGWRMWEEQYIPRCAPMELKEWDLLVQDAPKESLTFLDENKEEEPDIVDSIQNDWSRKITESNSYDYVIDSVSHLAGHYRKSKYYWNSIKHSLKPDGIYIGWDDSKYSHNCRHNPIRISADNLHKHFIDTY